MACQHQRHSSAVVLVAAVQTRSNNRIVVSGSLAQFSNAFYLRSQANRRFGDALSQCRSEGDCGRRELQVRGVPARAERGALQGGREWRAATARAAGAGGEEAQPAHLAVVASAVPHR